MDKKTAESLVKDINKEYPDVVARVAGKAEVVRGTTEMVSFRIDTGLLDRVKGLASQDIKKHGALTRAFVGAVEIGVTELEREKS